MRVHLPPPIMWDATRTTWDKQALLLLEAFEIYDSSLCSACAQSSIHALDVKNTREFTIDDSFVCLGCNVRETWSEHNADSVRIKGQKVVVINRMGSAVPTDDE